MTAFWRSPVYVLCGAIAIAMIAFGVRQSFGLLMEPISDDMGWGREVFSFAIALQNLIIGLAAPLVAACGDRWGLIRVVAACGVIYTVAMLLMSTATTPALMIFSVGALSGLGVSGCGLALMMALVGRVAPDDKRSLWLGLTTGGATAGQLVVVPMSSALVTGIGWVQTVVILGAMTALILPLALSLGPGSKEAMSRPSQQSLGEAVREAVAHRGYWLLITGFFVCGFQVQFVASHLPAYLTDAGAAPSMGAIAIAVIGLFNMLGTWIAGWCGDRYRKKYLLSLIYTLRAVAIVVFLQFPVTTVSVVAFAAVLGLLWLSTAPLTSGIVAQVFGTRYMGTLFAITYMSHQLGSFTGVWLGGVIYDATGSYDQFWWLAIALGLVAALLHWPIDDRPVARLTEGA